MRVESTARKDSANQFEWCERAGVLTVTTYLSLQGRAVCQQYMLAAAAAVGVSSKRSQRTHKGGVVESVTADTASTAGGSNGGGGGEA